VDFENPEATLLKKILDIRKWIPALVPSEE
jgi:hypothetical protein